jgi:multiple sugar transport system substrate-binding protein
VTLARLTTACSHIDSTGSAAGSSGSGGTYPIWNPSPQFDDSSDWVKLLTKCGTDAGITAGAVKD